MKINWIQVIVRLPGIIKGGVLLAQQLKIPGASKKQKVLDAIPDALGLAEDIAGKDFLNDPAILALMGAVVDTEAAVLKAKNALREGLLTKAGIVPPTP